MWKANGFVAYLKIDGVVFFKASFFSKSISFLKKMIVQKTFIEEPKNEICNKTLIFERTFSYWSR